ncbi:MAG: autotransporter-associated beta strand repeat-containing protein [Erythrobacter sp.]
MPGSATVFDLGAIGSADNDLIRVTGNLALNGGAIRVVRGAGFEAGRYTLFAFGTLSGALGNLTLDPLGGGFLGNLALGDRTVLLNAASAGTLVWWNGSTTSPTGAVVGGDGTWSLGAGNFTNANGDVSGLWAGNGALAVFGGTGGLVTIAPGETFTPAGLNLVADGYVIAGGDAAAGLALAGPTGIDTAPGVGATIAASISGAGSLTKTGDGTLRLTGTNTFTGAANVLGGTLANSGTLAGDVLSAARFVNSGTVAGSVTVNSGGSFSNAGSIAGDVTNSGSFSNAGTLGAALINSGNFTNTGSIAGLVENAGTLTNDGILAAALTNSGTLVNGGTLGGGLVNVAGGSASSSGSIAGGVTNAGTPDKHGQHCRACHQQRHAHLERADHRRSCQ